MWVVKFALVGVVAASHYEKPPCQADEMAGQLASGAEMCAPKCSASGTCPTDVPAGATATPQCALKTTSGDKYCGLVCKGASECPTGGQCSKPVPFMPTGICTYKTGVAAESNPPALSPEWLFQQFAATVGRIYGSAEERQHRFAVFVENLEHMSKMQALDGDATYSHISPFADWTVDEFSARNTLRPHLLDSNHAVKDTLHNTSGLPDAFDWREKGAVNDVKNQAQCGSCWAFSTVANIEGVNFVKTNKLLSLSEQELVDCDKTGPEGDQGCKGGLPSNAFKYMIANKLGLDAESKYPYAAKDGTCHVQKADEQVFISAWKQIASDEDQMAAALVQYGPLSIGINAAPMQWYMGGISNPWSILCNPKSIDHGVAIVGYGSQPKKYWTIRNSWGASWGEKGYYRIVRGVNKCGLTTMPTTAIIGGNAAVVV